MPSLGNYADIIEAIRSTYDVDHVTYYALSLGVDARDKPGASVEEFSDIEGVVLRTGRKLAALSFPTDWLKWYTESGFHESDPVLISSTASFDPVDWGSIDWSRADRKVFKTEAANFGVGSQGYTIPVRGPGGQLALFTINKQCTDHDWDLLLAEHRTDFLLLAHFTHQRFLHLAGLEHTHPTRPLSNRERDAMRLIADGMSRGRASEKLGISENTFRVYIDSARHKLGALNIPHAIALAAHRGLIPPT